MTNTEKPKEKKRDKHKETGRDLRLTDGRADRQRLRTDRQKEGRGEEEDRQANRKGKEGKIKLWCI